MVAQRDFPGHGGFFPSWVLAAWPLLGRLLQTQIVHKLMFILVLLLRLTYCQSSQVTGMLTAVKKQFVSTKLQLKYYQAAILDWQCSERFNSQQLPLAKAGMWQAGKYNTFTTNAGHLVIRHVQPSAPIGHVQRATSRGADFWKVNL